MMTLAKFYNNYHLIPDTDDCYDTRYEYAQCFVCDAMEHPSITATYAQIVTFAEAYFDVQY
jgi:hypothetical protein